MPDEEEDWEMEARRLAAEESARDAAYDRQVAQALSSAEWISTWSVMAFQRHPMLFSSRLATGWVRVSQPTREFLNSLERLSRVQGRDGAWNLILDSPTFMKSDIQHQWCVTVSSVLNQVLAGKARFVACMLIIPERC